MLRLVAHVTIICFLTVSALGNGCGQICARGACEASDSPQSEAEPAQSCNSCGSSNPTPTESPCHRQQQAEPPCHRSCESEPAECAATPCHSNLIIVNPDSPGFSRPPCETKCGHCIKPHLEFTLGEKKISTPRPVLAIGEGRDIYTADFSLALSGEKERPGGIHPIISTTILRL